MPGYRRMHEKALARIIDRIVDMILKKEIDLQTDIDLWKAAPETMEKLARIQDLSSRRYQTSVIKRELRKILKDSNNLLVATIVERMEN